MRKSVQGILHGKYIEICVERAQRWFGKGQSEQRDNGQAQVLSMTLFSRFILGATLSAKDSVLTKQLVSL